MATLDYVDIPSAATRLQSHEPSKDLRPAMKISTSLPQPERSSSSSSRGLPPTPTSQPMSPSKTGFNLSQVLLSSALPLPANLPSTPRATQGTPKLLSTRDPLSIPITTVNFRRFVGKVGPVFWLQDRLEEIVMWRRGWKYTCVWIAAYAFLCFFPRLALLLPNVALLGVLLAKHPIPRDATSEPSKGVKVPPPPTPQVSEFSTEWLANVQAIQNLMGAASDAVDFVYPAVPHLTYSSPFSPIILTAVAALSIILIPIVNLIPMRTTFLIAGLLPFVFTHPLARYTLAPLALQVVRPQLKRLRTRLTRLIDNDRLQDKHWRSELKEVQLWENERWAGTPGEDSALTDLCWSKINLKPGERKGWTRGRDGWSGISEDGAGDVSSNLTFSLSPGWAFVETEEWRPDLEGTWIAPIDADDNGWVYTNDTWMDPRPVPLDEWKQANGLTRRRRWVRRIYYDPTLAA